MSPRHPLRETVGAPSSSFSQRLKHPRCKKERFHRPFILTAIRLWNASESLRHLKYAQCIFMCTCVYVRGDVRAYICADMCICWHARVCMHVQYICIAYAYCCLSIGILVLFPHWAHNASFGLLSIPHFSILQAHRRVQWVYIFYHKKYGRHRKMWLPSSCFAAFQSAAWWIQTQIDVTHCTNSKLLNVYVR